VEDFSRHFFYANLTKPLFMKCGLVPFFIKSGTNSPRQISTSKPSQPVSLPVPREASGGVNRSFCQASELNPKPQPGVNPSAALFRPAPSSTFCEMWRKCLSYFLRNIV
jgi:hypothetical protein